MKELSSNPAFGILEVLDREQAIERGLWLTMCWFPGRAMKYGMTQRGITVRKHCTRKPSMVIANGLRR